MEVKVPKEIRDYQESIFSASLLDSFPRITRLYQLKRSMRFLSRRW